MRESMYVLQHVRALLQQTVACAGMAWEGGREGQGEALEGLGLRVPDCFLPNFGTPCCPLDKLPPALLPFFAFGE